jgi:hypothetical protein
MRLLTCLGLLSLTALAACNPTFNWREVRLPDTRLAALLPCKPNQATRPMMMGTAQVDLHLQGCETGAATFAIATLTAPGDASSVSAVLTAWQAAALAPLKAIAPQLTTATSAIRIAGAPVFPLPQSPQKITAVGQRADGRRIESQAVYFAQGQQLFQAVILAERISPDMAETFFSGLKLQ